MKKEWIAQIQGRQIRVTNSWLRGAKLYIDGEQRAANTNLFANPTRPSLSSNLVQGDNTTPLVEIFFNAIVTVKAKICVDGTQIAGDSF
jgi:hypothetical protein